MPMIDSRWLSRSLGGLLLVSGCADLGSMDDSSMGSAGGSSGGELTSTSPDSNSSVAEVTGGGTAGGGDSIDDSGSAEGVGSAGSTSSAEGSGSDADEGLDSTMGIVCGNDVIEEGEDCDGAAMAGEDCLTLGYVAGWLVCAPDCTFDTTGCASELCGDGMIQGTEVCDGAELAGKHCTDLGFDGGTLGCRGDCQAFDVSGCFVCGDGIIGGMEVCDGADHGGKHCTDFGFDGGELLCLADCSGFDTSGCSTCGDTIIGNGEVCDGSDMPESCVSLGYDYGTLQCQGDCTAYDTSGCGDYGGGCCTTHATPGCDDAACTAAVCATTPFCCDVQWDQLCVDEAFAQCSSICDACGDGMINSPVEVCDGSDLGGEDCTSQGLAFGTLGCQADCAGFDISQCSAAGGDCCSASGGSPGCSDGTCAASICAVDPECCLTDWDSICASRADGSDGNGQACEICGLGCSQGLCTMGSDNASCQGSNPCVDSICAVDPFCCSVGWDSPCVVEVGSVCGLTCP